jgi:Ca2+/Na+ antiporter
MLNVSPRQGVLSLAASSPEIVVVAVGMVTGESNTPVASTRVYGGSGF